MTAIFILTVIGAYLLGAVPAAYLIAKWVRGIDLRQYGSGNIGAANVITTVSKRWGVAVVAFDLLKGVAAIYIARWIGLDIAQQAAVGVAVIVGHNWSVFLRFSSGRGGLAIAGVAITLSPPLGLSLVTFTLILGLFRQLALGMLIAVAALPICSWFLSQPLGITDDPLPLTLGFMVILVLTLIRRATVPRSAISASLSTADLLLNRLLFDRDIRNREAWIHRTPAQTERDEPETKPERD
ncbi:MAG: glycerol-3-phosphate acyltransferase [Chloroflexi bacterium]|nr:glycerol-3-phosphate acyltransferase [Chloroflexota bacterium]